MALFLRGQRCRLCGQPMLEGPVFGTWGVWLPNHDPLWKFCDGSMHWDCYASWPHRQRFASTYFHFWVEAEATNAFWHRAFLDDEVLVTVNPFEPVNAAWVHLKDTGSRIDVKLKNWVAWLGGTGGQQSPGPRCGGTTCQAGAARESPHRRAIARFNRPAPQNASCGAISGSRKGEA